MLYKRIENRLYNKVALSLKECMFIIETLLYAYPICLMLIIVSHSVFIKLHKQLVVHDVMKTHILSFGLLYLLAGTTNIFLQIVNLTLIISYISCAVFELLVHLLNRRPQHVSFL